MARILVADDNELSLEFFAESLTQYGHIADTAKDGIEACLRASEQRYDLMIIDLRMPLRNGSEALLAIRQGNGPSSDTRAIATTAAAGIDSALLNVAGFSAVAIKPITLAALGDLLESHLLAPALRTPLLNDDQVLTRIGGDAGIMDALRKLLAVELDALPAELEAYAGDRDLEALRDRLHRLDASAGFCGANRLASAAQALRCDLDKEACWPERAIINLLEVSAETRNLLG